MFMIIARKPHARIRQFMVVNIVVSMYAEWKDVRNKADIKDIALSTNRGHQKRIKNRIHQLINAW